MVLVEHESIRIPRWSLAKIELFSAMAADLIWLQSFRIDFKN